MSYPQTAPEPPPRLAAGPPDAAAAEAVPPVGGPAEAVPPVDVPVEAVPPQAVPAEAVPPQAVPAEAVPPQAVPQARLPETGPPDGGAAASGPGAAGPAADEDEPRGPGISPSRAGDFMTCPLLYRFRVIDRLPEPPSPAAARGTLVHAVLERLFDRPAAERTPQAARSLLGPEWDRLVAESPELAALFDDEAGRGAWTAEVTEMLDRYFTMEDPTRIEPAERELYVETTLGSGLRLRGYVDRLDVAAGGAVRIVDYKTGTAPREEFEARALFQMKFYALVLWLLRGQVPRLLQLMYLGNGEILRYQPDEADLRATERKIQALWRAIERARESGDWRPRPSRVCDWCAHKPICPAFGGTPPPLPAAPAPDPAETTATTSAETPAAAPAETSAGAPSG